MSNNKIKDITCLKYKDFSDTLVWLDLSGNDIYIIDYYFYSSVKKRLIAGFKKQENARWILEVLKNWIFKKQDYKNAAKIRDFEQRILYARNKGVFPEFIKYDEYEHFILLFIFSIALIYRNLNLHQIIYLNKVIKQL